MLPQFRSVSPRVRLAADNLDAWFEPYEETLLGAPDSYVRQASTTSENGTRINSWMAL